MVVPVPVICRIGELKPNSALGSALYCGSAPCAARRARATSLFSRLARTWTRTDWSENRVYGLSPFTRASDGSRAICASVGGGGGSTRMYVADVSYVGAFTATT